MAYIWKGDICIKGLRSALVVPCVAVPHNDANGLPPMTRDTSSWPGELLCDSANLKSAADVSADVNQSRLYVRFVPVDSFGTERTDDKLESLAAMLMERALLFEVPCTQSHNQGSLFLWSSHTSHGRYSMYGGFKPSLPS